jgi:glutamyl-tRNA reductase
MAIRPEHSPFRDDLHPAGVDGEGIVFHHVQEARAILVLDLAHPRVIAGVADGIDGLFKIVRDRLWLISQLNPQTS